MMIAYVFCKKLVPDVKDKISGIERKAPDVYMVMWFTGRHSTNHQLVTHVVQYSYWSRPSIRQHKVSRMTQKNLEKNC